MQYCIEHTKGFKLVDVSCFWPCSVEICRFSTKNVKFLCGVLIICQLPHAGSQGKTRDIYANILQFWFVLLAVQEARAVWTPLYMLFDDKVGRKLCGFALQILCLVILAKLMKAQLHFCVLPCQSTHHAEAWDSWFENYDGKVCNAWSS